jgi:hypothetical protein
MASTTLTRTALTITTEVNHRLTDARKRIISLTWRQTIVRTLDVRSPLGDELGL